MCAKYSSECSVFVRLTMNGSSVLGESASHFIDEGDDLTRERERAYVCY